MPNSVYPFLDGIKPPPGSVVNWSHRLAQGLIFFSIINEGSGTQTLDVAGGLKGTFSATAPTWQGGYFGTELNFNGNSRVEFGNPSAFVGLKAITVEGRFSAGASQGGGFGTVVSKDDGNTQRQFDIDIDSGSHRLRWYINGSGSGLVGNGSISPNGVADMQAVGTWSADGELMNLYINGLLNDSSSGSAPTMNSTSTANVAVGCRSGGNSPLTGTVKWARVWNRVLAPDEVKDLFENPFSMMRGPEAANVLKYGPRALTATVSGTTGIVSGLASFARVIPILGWRLRRNRKLDHRYPGGGK